MEIDAFFTILFNFLIKYKRHVVNITDICHTILLQRVQIMGFESSLNTENFKNIYNILCNTNPEGILTVSDDKRTKHIYFTSDYIYLSGDYCKDKIEKILLVAGRVNEDELEIIRNGQKKSNKILDELFLEKQLLSKEELLQIGHEQIIEEFCDFFFWENSNFSFQSEWDKSTLPTDCKAIPILHFSDLLYSIYEQMKEWEYVRRHIRSLSLIFILQEENFITSEMLNKHEMANEIQEIIQYLYGSMISAKFSMLLAHFRYLPFYQPDMRILSTC